MPVKTLPLHWGTTTRKHITTGAEAGAGGSIRLYVGRIGNFDYWTYLSAPELAHTHAWWDDVGRITTAALRVWVDDGGGVLGNTMPSGSPNVTIRRATDGWGEFTNSPTFVSGDWTLAVGSPDRSHSFRPSREGGTRVDVGVSGFIEDMAPARVLRRDGGACRALTSHGLILNGTAVADENWAIFSDDETVFPDRRPVLILDYEFGPTRPNAPTNLAPTGDVTTVGAFAGDFADTDTADRLARSHVQVWAAAASRTGSAAADNWVTVTDHGYRVGALVWFLSLTGGAGLAISRPYWVKTVDGANRFNVTNSNVSGTLGPVTDITTAYTALTVVAPLYDGTRSESQAAINANRFSHTPPGLNLVRDVPYSWRCRVFDNEGDVSPFSATAAFTVTNAPPAAPALTSPAAGQSFATMANATFSGGFSDPDTAARGDFLHAYQVQLSAFPEGDARWLDDAFILWNTGQVEVNRDGNPTTWSTGYTGGGLPAGTYHWRARVWDNHGAAGPWSFRSVVLTQAFAVDPRDAPADIQQRPRAPWRIVIRDMFQSDGVTRTAGRGPGRVVAILEDAMNVGASLMYNSPGEAHWTLSTEHPQISVIEPRQTHYAIEFAAGDGWREAFAGLVWSADATDKDVVFKGVDYLALLERATDTRYDPANIDRDFTAGGSKYTNQAIRTIIIDQLTQARNKADSPVGFIVVDGVNFPTMADQVTIWSTYEPTLSFCVGLIDSHRAGRALNTRLSVMKTSTGYSWVIHNNPGVLRNNLRLRYGELVQGYRVKPFSDDWYTRISAIGRERDGVKVRYSSQVGVGINEAIWGRFDLPVFIDGINDANDLQRRARQMATAQSRLGRQIGLGIREGLLLPRDGYDLMDRFPVEIVHGAVDTTRYGHDGEWTVVGITWQSLQRGDSTVTFTLLPKESGSAPSADLMVARPISPQAEWQVGWRAPDPLRATGLFWLDQSTGTVWRRANGTLIRTGVTGTV